MELSAFPGFNRNVAVLLGNINGYNKSELFFVADIDLIFHAIVALFGIIYFVEAANDELFRRKKRVHKSEVFSLFTLDYKFA